MYKFVCMTLFLTGCAFSSENGTGDLIEAPSHEDNDLLYPSGNVSKASCPEDTWAMIDGKFVTLKFTCSTPRYNSKKIYTRPASDEGDNDNDSKLNTNNFSKPKNPSDSPEALHK
jgi:hypothetical protein